MIKFRLELKSVICSAQLNNYYNFEYLNLEIKTLCFIKDKITCFLTSTPQLQSLRL